MSEPLTAAQRVAIARHPQRPNITDYIQALFTDLSLIHISEPTRPY